MANPRVANCIFCDDIRAEVGNKYSLMGIFAADIAFPMSGPVILPKFGIVVWILFDVGDAPDKFTIRVLGPPNRSEILRVEGTGSEIQFPYPPDEYSKGSLRFVIPIMNFIFNEEGFIEVMVETDRETIRAGRLRVRFNVKPEEVGLPPIPANAPEPPSSQPQPDAQESSSQP